MNKKLVFTLFLLFFRLGHAASPDQAPLSVWVNEALVATYSFSYKNFLEDQKKIAKYFTAAGWIAYVKAMNNAKLPETVQKNLYFVSSVATLPPVITNTDPTHWKASMELLVLFQNPEYKQRQYLQVTIELTQAPSGQGVRGYAINNLQAVEIKPSCKCAIEEANPPSITPNNSTQ